MKSSSIKKHMSIYSIRKERQTTVAHAFASALVPVGIYLKTEVDLAMTQLGQTNVNKLTCVYCGDLATTWDHLINLVRKKTVNLAGHGHQLGNLVPCCKGCNSGKTGNSFENFIASSARVNPAKKAALVKKLKVHLKLAKPIKQIMWSRYGFLQLTSFIAAQKEILHFMQVADDAAVGLHLLPRHV